MICYWVGKKERRKRVKELKEKRKECLKSNKEGSSEDCKRFLHTILIFMNQLITINFIKLDLQLCNWHERVAKLKKWKKKKKFAIQFPSCCSVVKIAISLKSVKQSV